MTTNYPLLYSISLSNYIINVYSYRSTVDENVQNVIDEENSIIEHVNSLAPELSQKSYPREIIESLDNLKGVSKIEVLDLNNNILLISSVLSNGV